MTSYKTFDNLPDLTQDDMAKAKPLVFNKYSPVSLSSYGATKWDNVAKYETDSKYAILSS